MIVSVDQALEILDGPGRSTVEREMAAHYLKSHVTPKATARLVQALQDDDPGVAWTAAEALSRLGEPAVWELLRALSDHDRAGDPRLLTGAYQALYHMPSSSFNVPVNRLMEALKGPAPDLSAMEEAHRLLQLRENGKRL